MTINLTIKLNEDTGNDHTIVEAVRGAGSRLQSTVDCCKLYVTRPQHHACCLLLTRYTGRRADGRSLTLNGRNYRTRHCLVAISDSHTPHTKKKPKGFMMFISLSVFFPSPRLHLTTYLQRAATAAAVPTIPGIYISLHGMYIVY